MAKRTETVIQNWTDGGGAIHQISIPLATFLMEHDFEAVVRCKDCYYCATEKSFGKVYHYCEAFEQYAEGDLIGVSLQVNPDHFCSWGERREDG